MSATLSQEYSQHLQQRSKVEDMLKRSVCSQEVAPITQSKAVAARFLECQGYDILEYDWTFWNASIDIVCRDSTSNTIVFVSVDAKADENALDPSVLQCEGTQLNRIAEAYFSEHNCGEVPVRFDVVAIIAMAADRAILHHYVGRGC